MGIVLYFYSTSFYINLHANLAAMQTSNTLKTISKIVSVMFEFEEQEQNSTAEISLQWCSLNKFVILSTIAYTFIFSLPIGT